MTASEIDGQFIKDGFSSGFPASVTLAWQLTSLAQAPSSDQPFLSSSPTNTPHFKNSTMHPFIVNMVSKFSEAEKSFILDILRDLVAIPVAALATKEGVEALADAIVTAFLDTWLAHLTESKPTKCSKSWWTDECLETFGVYQLSHLLADCNKFKKACKDAKCDFFDECITEIATSRKHPWDLMEWVKQRKLPPCEAIRDGGQPCHDMDDLWDTLHSMYNSASGRKYDTSVLDELPDELVHEWADFSEHELWGALKRCSNSSAPGPDHVTWVHLKELLKDKHVLVLFIMLANACLQVGYWLHIFKESLLVIVLKPNKPSYAVLKAFRPIVLLITFMVLDGSPLAIYKHVRYAAWVLGKLLKDVRPPNHEPCGSNT
ncbi:unnamed protein product [Cyclocybe aegerita]|uniref:Uncharacterized protein n=1 Tax=Cyclocybe aegerita TaxID=1973307 RepID=A0A8S0VV42_CYCAE|nr:unnamed protein product [Cyclocybe aegerita]